VTNIINNNSINNYYLQPSTVPSVPVKQPLTPKVSTKRRPGSAKPLEDKPELKIKKDNIVKLQKTV
jgi:hypothetical protein